MKNLKELEIDYERMLKKSLEEFELFSDELEKNPKLYLEEDSLFSIIKMPDGKSKFIGSPACKSLGDISRNFYWETTLYRYANFDSLMKMIKGNFAKVIASGGQLSKEVRSQVSDVFEAIDRDCESYRVIVPFIFKAKDDSRKEMKIGKVRLYNSVVFNDEKTSYLSAQPGSTWALIEERILTQYSDFHWFLEIPVNGVQGLEKAKSIGEDVARFVTNIFHLRVSIDYSDRMTSGFGLSSSTNEGVLFKTVEDKFTYLYSDSALGNVGLPDNLTDFFQGEYWQDFLSFCANSIELFLDFKTVYPVNQRVFEAIHWYGDAVREKTPTVAVVKYLTALERLLVFQEKTEGISERISNRTTALLLRSGFIEITQLREIKRKVKHMYTVRSEILHGVASPFKVQFKVPVHTIEEICRETIISFCMSLGPYLDRDIDDKMMLMWIRKMVKKDNINNIKLSDD